jgi:hypothetical protein
VVAALVSVCELVAVAVVVAVTALVEASVAPEAVDDVGAAFAGTVTCAR